MLRRGIVDGIRSVLVFLIPIFIGLDMSYRTYNTILWIESSTFPALFCSDVNYLYRTMFFPEIIFIFYCLKSANDLCDNPFVDFLGKYSYHIFLWNYPALAIYFAMLVNGIYPADPSSVSGIIFLAGLNLALAIISYILLWMKFRKKTC